MGRTLSHVTRSPEASGGGGETVEGTVLWEPSARRISQSRLGDYLKWLESRRGLVFAGYQDLWQWSVDRLEEFWSSVWDYFDIVATGDPSRVLVWGNGAEGATWFPDTSLNYVEQVLRQPRDSIAVIACSEGGDESDDDPRSSPIEQLSYGRLFDLVGAAAAGLRKLGVGRGDRVAAVLPNGVAAIVGFLATASIGATWSSCAPEFGARSMVDRFRQIEPKVLLVSSGYTYRGRRFDLGDKLAELERELPGLKASVVVPAAGGSLAEIQGRSSRMTWDDLLREPAEPAPERVPFSHPLWILYSSGTTGLPKPIVQGHGGILLEHLKALSLHSDVGPGERFFWFTTTGWMMWNFLVGGLLVGATIVCYDGDPSWPDASRLWRLADQVGITYFGTSAPYIEACRKAGLSPRDLGALQVKSVGSTGAPLSPEGFAWAAREIADDVLVGSVSGGTDVCTAFLASCPLLPVRAGELQCRALGAKVEAFDEGGRSVVGEVGELVVSEPMPSMPIAFWGDDGTRLHESYFARFEGVWRHGDWVKLNPDGGAVVYGRSDATLNRDGVRMGTSEFYRVVESLPEVADALVVDTSELGRHGELLLFVVPGASGAAEARGRGTPSLSSAAEGRIRKALRDQLSPRHVPDRIIAVKTLPRTINGKKVEVPVRRILLGAPPEKAVAPGALADPEALEGLLETISAAGLK